jgi:hypothetical protein
MVIFPELILLHTSDFLSRRTREMAFFKDFCQGFFSSR